MASIVVALSKPAWVISLNPLVNVLLGVLVLRERLPWMQWLAVGLAAVGVTYAVIAVGQPPWIALTLAFSFGFYGLLRKLIIVEPLLGLTVETSILAPLALVYLIIQGQPLVQQSSVTGLLLVGCGVVTAFPLFCFNSAAQHLQLSTLGFFQYIAPTVQLALGIWLYHEPFTRTNWIVFGCIWTALALYSSTLLLIPKTQS
jgi:chloramphenicol-sensitive protein RarD